MKKLIVISMMLVYSSSSSALDIMFDYTYDTNGFFTDITRKDALEDAASIYESFLDNLSAINSDSSNSFNVLTFDPATLNSLKIDNFSIEEDTLIIFAGGMNLGTDTLGIGGPGGFSCSGFGNFCSDASTRGQGVTSGSSANDFGPWGGSITFNLNTNWYFGTDTLGLEINQFDFKSVALHELAHVFGFGTSDSFINVPNTDVSHFFEGTLSTSIVSGQSQEVAMDPTILNGTRKDLTTQDLAAFQSIGWQVPVTLVPEPSTYLMLGVSLIFLINRKNSV